MQVDEKSPPFHPQSPLMTAIRGGIPQPIVPPFERGRGPLCKEERGEK